MKRHLTFLCLVAVIVLFVGCRQETAEAPPDTTTAEVPGTTSPTDVGPVEAQAWLDDVTIGSEVGADGAIAAGKTGDDFKPGQAIHIAVETSDAPSGAAVKVMWYGPGETMITEETKSVVTGQKYLSFQAPNTKSWKKGDYRAEIWTGDEKVNTQQFNIV